MSRRWEFKPSNAREVVLLVVGALLVAAAAVVSIIGLVRITQDLLH